MASRARTPGKRAFHAHALPDPSRRGTIWGTMPIVERHLSPDGLLQLIVDLADDGDWSVGFDGFQWHTHGDLLMWDYGGSPESAVRAFVDDVLASRQVIVISRLDGAIHNAWMTADPLYDDMKYADPNETIEKRFWNGQPFDCPPFNPDSRSAV